MHTWGWVGHDYANPYQEAQAVDIGLKNGSMTYQMVYARHGADHRKAHMAQAKALGITLEEFQALLRTSLYTPRGTPSPAEQQTDEPGEGEDAGTQGRGEAGKGQLQPAAVGGEDDEEETG
jgi:hypothetical protein